MCYIGALQESCAHVCLASNSLTRFLRMEALQISSSLVTLLLQVA
jgi:hypothetical protein